MSDLNTPKHGDFAAYLEGLSQPANIRPEEAAVHPTANAVAGDAPSHAAEQTLEDVLLNGEVPDEEFLAELAALNQAQPLADEELERQALAHPGADGDPGTPE